MRWATSSFRPGVGQTMVTFASALRACRMRPAATCLVTWFVLVPSSFVNLPFFLFFAWSGFGFGGGLIHLPPLLRLPGHSCSLSARRR